MVEVIYTRISVIREVRDQRSEGKDPAQPQITGCPRFIPCTTPSSCLLNLPWSAAIVLEISWDQDFHNLSQLFLQGEREAMLLLQMGTVPRPLTCLWRLEKLPRGTCTGCHPFHSQPSWSNRHWGICMLSAPGCLHLHTEHLNLNVNSLTCAVHWWGS